MNRDLNDDLSDLLGGETAPTTSLKVPPSSYAPLEQTVFAEGCPKCRGTGSFISYSGRNLGSCFACKGAGKLEFKTSRATRNKAAAKREEKRKTKAQEAAAWRETNKDVLAWLANSAKRNAERNGSFTFPQSLLEAISQHGTLTDNQLTAAQRLMAKDEARKVEWTAKREQAAPVADVTALEQAFAVARERAKLPGAKGIFTKPLKLTHGEVSVAISSPKPGSKWDGMLFVRDAKDDERKLGYFKGGKFFRQGATPVEEQAVLAVAATPLEAVKAYAKAWSECGICGRMLLKAESIEAGIGPICAGKYGWGL